MEDDKNISTIIEPSMLDLKQTNKNAYDLIIEKAKAGFFADHQTAGSLKKFAQEILDASSVPGESDES